MSGISRRKFLTRTTATVGAAAVAAPRLLGAEAATAEETTAETATEIIKGTDIVTLGKTDIKTSVLGIGLGTRNGGEQGGLGPEGLAKFFHEAYDRGIRYFDTAMAYQTHTMVADAIKDLPRDELFVQTKIMLRGRASEASARQSFERARQELDIGHFDTVLMHCLMQNDWQTSLRPLWDVLMEAKEKGQVRAVGISMHSMAVLASVAESDMCDVCLVRVNPFGVNTDGRPEQTAEHLKNIHEKGIGTIGMKIFGESGLRTREQRLESLKYVLGLGTVDCFSIGMSSVEQLDENLALIEEAKVAVKEEAEEKAEEETEEKAEEETEEKAEEEAEVGAAA